MTAATRPSLFRDPNYRLYWIGFTFAAMGMQATLTANLWQVQELTGSTLQVGLVGLFGAFGRLFVAPFAGTIADRYDRRRVVQVCQISRLAVVLVLSVLTFSHLTTPPHVYVAVMLSSVIQVFDNPSRQALLPALVGRDRIADAIALTVPGGKTAQLLGPSIAGVLIGLWGTGSAYLVNVIAAIAMVWIFELLRLDKIDRTPIKGSILSGVTEAFRYVKENPLLWQLMAADVGAGLFVGYSVLLPALASDVFHVGPAGYGILAAAPSFGGIAGAALIVRLGWVRRKGLLTIWFTLAFCATGAALGFAPGFAAALLAAMVLGLTDTVAQIIRQTGILTEPPDQLRGRIAALQNMSAGSAPAIGQALLGASAGLFGAPLALLFGGAAGIAWVGTLAWKGRALRAYTR